MTDPIFWGVGDGARPVGQSGFTADVWQRDDGTWDVQLVSWAASGLGSEVWVASEHGETFPSEQAARIRAPFAVPDFLRLWEAA